MIAKNQFGKYSIPKEISYTYTAQFILNGGVHEETTIDYLKSIGGNIMIKNGHKLVLYNMNLSE